MNISERIKFLRTSHNLTQEKLANLLNLNNKSSIANYESGYSFPSDDVKIKMCKLFNCSLDYLIGKSDYKNENDMLAKISEAEDNMKLKDKIQMVLDNMNDDDKLYMIPIYNNVSLTAPYLKNNSIEGYMPIMSRLFDITDDGKYFVLHTSNKICKDIEYLLIQEQNYAQNNEIVLAILDNKDLLLKRLNKANNQFIILEDFIKTSSSLSQLVNLNNQSLVILGKVIGQFGKI